MSGQSDNESGKAVSPDTHFFYRLSRAQSHSAAESIISTKYCSDTIRNQTRHLQACSAVPQPNAPPRIHILQLIRIYLLANSGGCKLTHIHV
jgi:hypothetical protein